MRRRITVTIVAVVALALALSGLVSLLLVARAERRRAEADLTSQAVALAESADRIGRTAALANFARLLKLRDVRLVPINGGRFNGALPAGVSEADINAALVGSGTVIHGHHRVLVYAAAPVTTRTGAEAAFVLTRRVPRVPAASAYFLVTAALALVLAGIIGDWLGHRIARPLQEAERVTSRIAAGDLAATVPVAAGADDEMASLARSINTMAQSLARAQTLEQQFLMSVSHDLRTPLTSIRGFAEAISDGTADDAARAAVIIAAESRRLERLVQDLLDLAKLDAHQFSLDARPLDLALVVSETAEGFRPAADGYRLRLVVEAPATTVPVTADPDRVAQIVANLVENAIKFAHHEVTVRVVPAPHPTILVDDDGPGIPAADLALVFRRLHTANRIPARQIGSGLGLAIVAELAANMGGAVQAHSPLTATGGTRMSVTFPGRGLT